ncbi:hypothetical protein LX16_1804 [Stackebrandtia albiflava]|uniref:Secreted protein n=1 Tax=Stackebrandtia albiflava TaxID=406432 RepID=A0A562VDZ4_9ACTN|nr:HAD domain-containing protein [Stackebrandtia albiflava]TWJ16082.1 hypothetical protein LX16_1804 [Stackebrandtia albiflava]
MATDPSRPLLFLDVDGTLLPYGGATLPSSTAEWERWQHHANPQLAKLVPAHGPRLRDLGCELVWATAWMHDANTVIAPLLGLPPLPVADLPDAPEVDLPDVLHWKTRSLVEAASGRPFIWLDDEIGPLDREWVRWEHPGPALPHRVDASVGVTDADFTVICAWLDEVGVPEMIT